jgi:hypothetical protein
MLQKSKTPSGLTTNCPSPPKTPAPSMHVACNRHLSPGMDVGRAMGNLTASSRRPRCISLSHRIRATQRLVFPLFCCNTSFPGVASVFDTGASAYRLLAIFDSRLLFSLLSMPSANSPCHQRIRAGLSAASQRLDSGGHMQPPFQLANSFQCNAACRPSLPHVFQRASWPELAISPISRSIASA